MVMNLLLLPQKLTRFKRSQLQKHIKMIKTELNVVPGTKVLNNFSALTNREKMKY